MKEATIHRYLIENTLMKDSYLSTKVTHNTVIFVNAPDLTRFTPSPNFHFFNCTFKSFDNDSIHIYRDLKNKMSSLQNENGETLFASLEMRAENSQLKLMSTAFFDKLVSYFPFIFNKYGISILQPVLVWIGLFEISTLVYNQADLFSCVASRCTEKPMPDWYNYISSSDKLVQALYLSFVKNLGPQQLLKNDLPVACNSMFCNLWGLIQSALSTILLYIVITSIKKRFRQH